MTKIVVIGRSHAICMKRALDEALLGPAEGNVEILFTNHYEPIWEHAAASSPLNSALASELGKRLDGADGVALLIQGNQHSILSMLEQQPPLDFVFGDYTVRDDATLVFVTMVRNWYRNNLLELMVLANHLKRHFPGPALVMGPPPPIESAADIRPRLDTYFRDAAGPGAEMIISEPTFRLKCWALQVEVYKSVSSDLGLPFIEVPPSAVTEDGFLSEVAWGSDSTHANSWYGALRIRQAFEHFRGTP